MTHENPNVVDNESEREVLDYQESRVEDTQDTREDYPTTDDFIDSNEYGWDETAVEQPLPVYLVAPPPMDVDRHVLWRGGNALIVSDRATQIAPKRLSRVRLFIQHQNPSGDSVFLVSDPSEPEWAGFELMPGESVEMRHTQDVWAITRVGDTSQRISISDEYYLVDVNE
jgi:hypothetical protein